MGRTYDPTITFGNKWHQADQKISDALVTKKRIPFFVHELAPTLQRALDAVKIDKILSYLVEKWKDHQPLKVKDFSPDALQAYHGLALEKALKSRYQSPFMKNAKDAYSRASSSMGEISEYEKQFPQDLQFEK